MKDKQYRNITLIIVSILVGLLHHIQELELIQREQ